MVAVICFLIISARADVARIVVLPDTQTYVEYKRSTMTAMMDWIVAHRSASNFLFVGHVGDVINDYASDTAPEQWTYITNEYAKLEAIGLPYSILPGNHDYAKGARDSSLMNSYFPLTTFTNMATFGGAYDSLSDNTYHIVKIHGQAWLIMSLEFGPRSSVLAWANAVLQAHQDYPAIVITHAYLNQYGERFVTGESRSASVGYGLGIAPPDVNDGSNIWETLIYSNQQVRMMIGGHDGAPDSGARLKISQNIIGRTVYQLLHNYQYYNQPNYPGFLLILEFSTDGTVSFSTYSPTQNVTSTAEGSYGSLLYGEVRAVDGEPETNDLAPEEDSGSGDSSVPGGAYYLYDGTTNYLFATVSGVGSQTNTTEPLYDGSMVCYVPSNRPSLAAFAVGGNLNLISYEALTFVARVNDWNANPPAKPMINLNYADGSGGHGTLWLDITPYAEGDLGDGDWHRVTIPISAFPVGDTGWQGQMRNITVARTSGVDRPPFGSGYPDPTGPAYEMWFDNVALLRHVGPVQATGHVVVDSNLFGLSFPDYLEIDSFVKKPVVVEVNTGSGFAPVTVERTGRWSFPTMHTYGYTPAIHTFYFQLANNLIEGATYRVSYYGGTNTFVFNATNEICPGIKVNQVGYAPQSGRRYAYLGYFAGDGVWLGDGVTTGTVDYSDNGNVEVRRANDHQLVATITPVERGDAYNEFSGERVMDIDLAGVPPGESYYILLPGVGRSYTFGISSNKVFESFYTFARGLYHQRWNCELTTNYTSWPQPAGHTNVYLAEGEPNVFFDAATPKNQGTRVIRGGHHDAGDFDLRPGHAQIASILMTLCEYWPQKFSDGQLDIPESGNGIPDLLDEALYQLQAWRDLQEDDGGVRAGVESYAHPSGTIFAHEDSLPYWTFRREPSVSAYIAGLFAQASRLLRNYDSAASADYLVRAGKAYNYAVSNSAYSGWLMMAESHLLKTTENAAYAAPLEQRLTHISNPNTNDPTYISFSGNWPYGGLIGFAYHNGNSFEDAPLLAYITSPTNLTSTGMVTAARNLVINHGQQAVNFALASQDPSSPKFRAYRSVARTDVVESWGAATTPGRVMNVLAAYALNNSTNFLDAISLTTDLTLGCNPMGRVWATGLGVNNTKQALDAESLAWVERHGYDQVPGIPTYGPSSPMQIYYQIEVFDGHVPGMFTLPLERRYCDAWPLVQNNEFTVWESSLPAIAATALLLPDQPMAPSETLRDYHVRRKPPPELPVTEYIPSTYQAILRWWEWQDQYEPYHHSLLCQWEFDEDGGNTATDISTNQLVMQLGTSNMWDPVPPGWMDEPAGSALLLDGSTSTWGSVVSPVVDMSKGFTFGLWLRPDLKDNAASVIELRPHTTGANKPLLMLVKDNGGTESAGRLTFFAADERTTFINISTGRWYHLLVVYDPDSAINGEPPAGAGGEVRVYVNQINEPTPYAFGIDNQALVGDPLPVATAYADTAYRITLGRGYYNSLTFAGAVDRVALYNAPLDRSYYEAVLRPDRPARAVKAKNISASAFQAAVDPVGNATGYVWDVSTDVDFSNITRQFVSRSAAVTVTGLSENTLMHFYRARAKNKGGESESTDIVGVLRRPLKEGVWTPVSAPVETSDLSFSGDFGADLASRLSPGDEVRVWSAANQTWITLTLSANGTTWSSAISPVILEEGQGFFVRRASGHGDGELHLSGTIPGRYERQAVIRPSANVVSVAGPRNVTIGDAFASIAAGSAGVVSGFTPQSADMVYAPDTNGGFRIFMRKPSGWHDFTANSINNGYTLKPGEAAYYMRRGSENLTVEF